MVCTTWRIHAQSYWIALLVRQLAAQAQCANALWKGKIMDFGGPSRIWSFVMPGNESMYSLITRGGLWSAARGWFVDPHPHGAICRVYSLARNDGLEDRFEGQQVPKRGVGDRAGTVVWAQGPLLTSFWCCSAHWSEGGWGTIWSVGLARTERVSTNHQRSFPVISRSKISSALSSSSVTTGCV